MTLLNIQIEKLAGILAVLGESKHPILAYKVALIQIAIEPVLKALAKARIPSDAYTEYSKAQTALCETNAKKDANGLAIKTRMEIPEQGVWVDNYDIENLKAHQVGVRALEGKYNEAILAEAVRQRGMIELLNAPAELELEHKIKYSWCEDLLTGNNLGKLLVSGILVMDKEPQEVAQEKTEE